MNDERTIEEMLESLPASIEIRDGEVYDGTYTLVVRKKEGWLITY
jgi:hypothetical protein